MKKNMFEPGFSNTPGLQWRRTLLQWILWAAMLVVILVLAASCKSSNHPAVNADTYYTCSMDPQVVEYKPGKCPICHMDLTPVKKSKAEHQDELLLSEQQIQLGNITTDTLRNTNIGDRLVLTGTLNFDEGNSTSISSRVGGRIEKLYVKNLGDYVRKGDPIYELYSEELNSAKQEYLLAIDRKQAFANETAIDFEQLFTKSPLQIAVMGHE